MRKKFSNTGISLISLIITIIVIIILAAIVIFSGMDTPEKAQLSKVISDIDNVQTAVDQAYYGLYTEKAVAGEVWTKSQFYEAVATGKTNREDLKATGLVEIAEDSLVDINLPVYEGRKWYIAVSDVSDTVKVGSAVLSPGFESQGKTYATLLDVQNGGNNGGQGSLTEEDKAILASVNIGDFVGYMEANYNNGIWRIVDKDDAGNITLMTTSYLYTKALSGADGYINGIEWLDNAVRQYLDPYSIAIEARCFKYDDFKKFAKKYQSQDSQNSLEYIEKIDIEELAQKAGYKHGRYAVYSKNTPSELVKEVKIGDAIYYPVQMDGKFLGYDDENGIRHTAKVFEESADGYKVPKYNSDTGEAEYVLVTSDVYSYIFSIDGLSDELSEIFRETLGLFGYVPLNQYVMIEDRYEDIRFCYNLGLWNYEISETNEEEYTDLGFTPFIKINVNSLKNGGVFENDEWKYYGKKETYNIWNLKNIDYELTSEEIKRYFNLNGL